MGILPNISTGAPLATPLDHATKVKRLSKTAKGNESVERIASVLHSRGYHVKSKLPYNSKFDLLCNGKRVEVKTADMREDNSWVVNIHRHGILDEGQVDVYVFELHALFFPSPVLLFFPAPIGAKTLAFHLFGLIRGKYWNRVECWEMVEPIAKNPTLPQLLSQGGSPAMKPQTPTELHVIYVTEADGKRLKHSTHPCIKGASETAALISRINPIPDLIEIYTPATGHTIYKRPKATGGAQ